MSGQAESFCVDGEIKLVARQPYAAVTSYLQAHAVDPVVTKEHIESLGEEQRENVLEILHEWTKPPDQRGAGQEESFSVSPDAVWEFIFCLEPEELTSCVIRIEKLLKEKRYQEVIDSCTAVLKQSDRDSASLLLHRGLARTLIGNRDKDAISDYLRAFLKDKDSVTMVVRDQQRDFMGNVMSLMKNCVYSKPPAQTEVKAFKQWVALTVDCCRFLLTFQPNNFPLQMTFSDRLQTMHKTDKAMLMLTETLEDLLSQEQRNPEKIAEVLLRRATCYITKVDHAKAIADVTAGLNARGDWLKKKKNGESCDVEKEMNDLLSGNEGIAKIAKDIFRTKPSDITEVYGMLDKAASKLTAEDRFKSVVKLENIRAAIDHYRAMLVLQPANSDVIFKIANCYARFGKSKLAIKLYDKLLQDPHCSQESAIRTARASCYRETGEKVEAKKDLDSLLRNNPRDVMLLCERAMVYMDNDDVSAAVHDLLAASSVNQKLMVTQLNKEALVQRTRTRQILFEFAKSKLLGAPATLHDGQPSKSDDDATVSDGTSSSVALEISQLLTKLNPSDQSCHILMAHSMFHAGCVIDAETKLKKMLQEKSQGVDIHVVKLHLGMMKIFTKRRDDGMRDMLDVVVSKGERVMSSLLRDFPISERAKLSDESHQYGIELLHSNRDAATVKQAIHCFTLAILCCRGTDLVLEDSTAKLWLLLTDAHCLSGIHRKSDKMSNSAWSLAALERPTPSPFRFHPKKLFQLQRFKRRRLNGGTGVYRSYLARAECMAHLGDQRAAILDFSAAIEVNPQCVDGLCGRSFMRLALGEENDCVNDVTSACVLDLMNVVAHIRALPDDAKKLLLFWIDHRVVVLLLNYGYRSNDRLNTGGSASTISMLDETVFKPGEDESITSSLSSIHPPTPPQAVTDDVNDDDGASKKLHKSEANSQDLKDALLSIEPSAEPTNQQQASRGSTATTMTSLTAYDDPMMGLDKMEILNRALALGRLLITVDGGNAAWHGMYADILIVKGDYEEALRHLQAVMDLSPTDVTATARAGLINMKMNRFKVACRLLSSLACIDNSGLKYVLKALDSSRRRRLAEESFAHAELLNREGKYAPARDYYTLSLLADSHLNLEKLRMRSRCFSKLGDTTKAISDISDVIKELARKPQAHDYCVRASLYLVEGKEFQACRDFMKAIDVDKNQASSLINVKPGRAAICDVFYRQAAIAYGRNNFQECSDLCDVALIIDEGNIDLRKLRARAKREISKCTIQ